jgi:hypothetical protein
MLAALLLLLASLAVAPVLPRAPEALTLAPDSEARWIPFDLTPGNQIRFTMTLEGRTVTAVLDTGVSHSVLSRRSAAVRPDRLRPGGTATAIGGDVTIEWMPTDSLSLGGLSRVGGGVTVTAMPAMPIDLLVGRDLLAGQALDIDYPGRRFRLLASGRLPFRGQVAPLTISPERQVYESELSLGGRALRPVLVDTGDGSAVTVAAEGWRRAAPEGLRTTTAIAFGLAGPLVSELAIVPAVGVGALTARQVEVRVEPGDGFSTRLGVAGRIGSGLLQNYRVLLDPGARRMVLSPGPEADAPPLRSTSGLLVGVQRDRLRVLHVMRGGPGAAGGWREGDLICAVDGRPIPADYATSPLARWSIAAPGTPVRLADCAGRERTLVARAFY